MNQVEANKIVHAVRESEKHAAMLTNTWIAGMWQTVHNHRSNTQDVAHYYFSPDSLPTPEGIQCWAADRFDYVEE